MEESKKVFVDSNYFIAYFHIHDALHSQALSIGQFLDTNTTTLVISNYIFLEIVTVLSQKAGVRTARTVGQYLFAKPFIDIRHIDERLHRDTWEIFQKIQNKNVSFADCSTIALMQAEGIRTLLTFDSTDFKHLKKHFSYRLFHL